MIYLLCFRMMCHAAVVNMTTVWGLKELLAYLHVKAAAACSGTFPQLKLFYY